MHETENKLPLMEAFYTLQGEGFYSGHAAYFIRLGGCDVGCSWCDVKDSWSAAAHRQVPVNQIVKQAKSSGTNRVVITGGEPLLYDLSALTRTLKKSGLKVNIETAGVHPLSGTFDWVCFSPKKFKRPLPEIYRCANELKIIIYHESDFRWAEKFAQEVKPDCKLFLQAEWSRKEVYNPQIIAYIKKNPRWQLSVQVHKYLNIP